MAVTPTATHAYNLFALTMESRYGNNWRAAMAPEAIAALADEIVMGFGGQTVPAHHAAAAAAPSVWRFPDGSRALTGSFGLRREDMEEQAA